MRRWPLLGGVVYLDCVMCCLDSSQRSIQVSFLESGMITLFFMGFPVPGSWPLVPLAGLDRLAACGRAIRLRRGLSPSRPP